MTIHTNLPCLLSTLLHPSCLAVIPQSKNARRKRSDIILVLLLGFLSFPSQRQVSKCNFLGASLWFSAQTLLLIPFLLNGRIVYLFLCPLTFVWIPWIHNNTNEEDYHSHYHSILRAYQMSGTVHEPYTCLSISTMVFGIIILILQETKAT